MDPIFEPILPSPRSRVAGVRGSAITFSMVAEDDDPCTELGVFSSGLVDDGLMTLGEPTYDLYNRVCPNNWLPSNGSLPCLPSLLGYLINRLFYIHRHTHTLHPHFSSMSQHCEFCVMTSLAQF